MKELIRSFSVYDPTGRYRGSYSGSYSGKWKIGKLKGNAKVGIEKLFEIKLKTLKRRALGHLRIRWKTFELRSARICFG